MKYNSKNLALIKKLVAATVATIFVFLPPLIAWLAQNNLSEQIFNEKLNQLREQMNRNGKIAQQPINPYFTIYRIINTTIGDYLSNEPKVTGHFLEGKLELQLRRRLKQIFSNTGFPCEISACFFDFPEYSMKTLHFVNDRETKTTSVATATRIMFFINNGHKISPEHRSKRLKEDLHREMKSLDMVFADQPFLRGGRFGITRMASRNPRHYKMLVSMRVRDIFLINLVFDLSDFGQKRQAQHRANLLKERETAIAIIFQENGRKKIQISGDLQITPKIVSKAENLAKKSSKSSQDLFFDGFFVRAVPKQIHETFDSFLFAPIPKREKEPILQLLIAILSIIAIFSFKFFIELFLFGRHPRLSIQAFIVSLFLIVSLAPLLGSIYLSSEYVVSQFKLENNKAAKELEEHLTSIDLQTLDQFRDTVQLLRSFDTVEKIRAFTGQSEENRAAELLLTLLQQLYAKFSEARVSEAWIYDREGNLACQKYDSMTKEYFTTDNPDAFLVDLFRQRFNDYFQQLDRIHSKKRSANLELDELKTELLNELFLNFFGHRAFFNIKKNIGTLLMIKTFADSNYFYSLPLFENGKIKYILNHIIDSSSLRRHLPENLIRQDKDFLIFTLSGSKEYLSARPRTSDYYLKNAPETLQIGKNSHLSRLKLDLRSESPEGNFFHLAIPAQYSDHILVGRIRTRDLVSIKTELVREVGRATAGLVILMLCIALLVSRYFLAPIEELIRGTKAIINENYHVRVFSDHPDEFGEIGETFNQIARRLEEGKLLSSFVARSLENELENHDAVKKAERKDVSVIFSGICNFKSLIMEKSPEKLFELMQQHLEIADELVQDFGGEIEKMIEDKVMIVFEEQPGLPSSADRAIQFAGRLQKIMQERFATRLAIGINSGEVVCGVMGSEKVRMAKTVVGDPVNLAARLATVAEGQDGGIIVSGLSLNRASFSPAVKRLQQNQVKGKTQAVEIFAIAT